MSRSLSWSRARFCQTLIVGTNAIDTRPYRREGIESFLRDFGPSLAKRPSFSADAAWIAAGPEVLSLATDTRVQIEPGLQTSMFLADGRILGVRANRLVRAYCPGPAP